MRLRTLPIEQAPIKEQQGARRQLCVLRRESHSNVNARIATLKETATTSTQDWIQPSLISNTSRTSGPQRPWRPFSFFLIGSFWAILYLFFGLFSPGLLDDVDSVYTEIAREMLARHDFVTPTVDGIRFFDKPPLMYWMAAGSMRLFGPHDWAARLPLALGVLALLLAVYALGIRLFAALSPASAPDRGGLYAALATGISIGPYLYTRFYIPDILIALWMTLSVHLLLIALQRLDEHRSTLWPSLAFAAVAALNVLTKGLIGLVFPLGFVLLYLLWTRRLSALRDLHLTLGTFVFALIAAPWHILAALRNPAIPMPPGLGLPARAGWTWFYLYNEHIARFLQKRIPHDYGQVPIPLFWLLLFLWLIPWTGFVFPAIANAVRTLRHPQAAYPFISFARSRSRPPPLGRPHSRLLHSLLAPGVLPPPRAASPRPARWRPPRRSRYGPQASPNLADRKRRPAAPGPRCLPLVSAAPGHPALRPLRVVRTHRTQACRRSYPERAPKL